MKILICLLSLISLSLAGHIYVSEATLDYQNQNYFKSALLYFKLENDLMPGEVIQLVWPFSFGTTPSTSIMTIGGTSNLVSSTKIQSSETQIYLITIGTTQLNAGTWYSLNISRTSGLDIAAGYYNSPIQLATYSGESGGALTNYQLYDYNSACGFVSIAPSPTTLQSVTASLSATDSVSITSVTENYYFEKSYYVYLTVLTTNDYEYGGTYYFKMNGPFTFTGSVEAINKTCGAEDTGCVSIYPLILNRDYNYKITENDKVIQFVRYQNASGLAIAKNEYLKIKVKVKNPSYVSNSGSLTVNLVSNYAKYIYEYKTESGLFSTKAIELGTNSTLYFWGVPYDAGTSKGCPIRVYLSNNYAIWNKITIRFYPKQIFPDSDGFKMQMNADKVDLINDLSIFTDMSSIGASISCSVKTISSVDYIVCTNIGKLSQNTVYSVKFSYVVNHVVAGLDLSDFGKLEFYHQNGQGEATAAITNSITPPDNNLTQLVKNADYNKQTGLTVLNPVVDVATTTGHDIDAYPTIFGQTSATAGRSSIKAQTDAIDLVIIILGNYEQTCCGVTNPQEMGEGCISQGYVNTGSAQNTNCAATTSSSLIIKVLANVNALSFDNNNLDDSSVSDIYKGVEILFGSKSGGTAAQSFFGGKTTDNINEICISTVEPTENICNNNYATNYKTLATLQAGPLYTYNQWQWCMWRATQTATAYHQGIRIKDVTLNTQANPLYPGQYEIDFIVCFRFINEIGSSKLNVDSTSTYLASSGVYNAQIINFQTAYGNTASSTIFRVGILNYYEADGIGSPSNDYKYIPTLLRVGGNMNSTDVGSNEGVAFFFDKGFHIGQDQVALKLDPTQCYSPIAASPVCRYFARKLTGTAPTDYHSDYYPGLNAIIMGGSAVTGGSEFNYYIPVKVTETFAFAFIALINSYATNPTISKIYKICGSKEINDATYPIPATIFTLADYDNSQDIVLTEYGTFQGQSTTHTISQSQIIDSSFNSKIKPSETCTSLILDASVSGAAFTDKLNDNPNFIGASATQFNAAQHFQVHSFENYWSGASLSWDMENSATSVPFKGKCKQMAFTGDSIQQYMIICPYEGTFTGTQSIVDKGTLKLNVSTWKWPDYYGYKSTLKIGAHLRFLWTGAQGNLLGFYQSGLTGNSIENCTLGSASSIFAYNTTQQKATLQITPLTSLLLKAAASGEGDRKQMTISVKVNASQSSDPKITTCASGIANVKCTVGLDANDKDFTFTLQNIDSSNDVTIPASQISLNFWLFSTVTTPISDLNYSATISATFYTDLVAKTGDKVVINECNNAETWQGMAQQDRSISVQDPSKHCQIKGARTYFSFVFTANYDVVDISKFKINLAFLDSPNSGLIDNLRCGLYTNQGISHDFSTFNYNQLSGIEIQYKQTQTALDYATSVGHSSFTFKCDGGQVIDDNPSTLSLITVENYVSAELIGKGSGTDQSEKYALNSASSDSSVATISMSRMFDSVGQDSTYTFNVKVTGDTVTNTTTNITTTNIRYQAGSYLYVEFARDISPRFNKLGILRCYHEEYPTYCNYESERRIAIIIRTDLNHNQTFGHNFTVVGVQRPITFSRNKIMYFALVPYLSSFKSLTFHDSSSITDEAPDTLSSTLLPVVYYSQDSKNAIRSNYGFTMHIKFPAGRINSEVPLWVDFPEEFDEAMFLGWSPSCQLKNVRINDTDNITNYASSCTTNITRRVKITLVTDEENGSTERLYALTISGIPTYHYEQPYANPPLVWMGNTTDNLIPYYKTNLGYFNGTENLAKFTFQDSATKQLLYWSGISECHIGVYDCKPAIVVNTGVNFQADIDSITSGGTYAQSFSFNPSKLKLNTGVAKMEFEMAPKYSTAPGFYQLTWSHEATTYYSVIPPLFIIALNSKVELKAESNEYDVPDKGYSLPIIFSFAGKMPESEITITGQAKSALLNSTGTETSRYIFFRESSKTLTYSESYISSQIYFVVTGEKVIAENEPDTQQATLSWTLSGANAKAYSNPIDVTVKIVDAPEGTPELTLETTDSTASQQRTFTATCTHTGNLYYIASQSQTETQIEYTTIQAATENKQIQETEIGTVYTNPARTFQGFKLYTSKGSAQTLILSGKFQSEAIYYLRMFCVNQVGTASEAKDVTWTQATNGGKPLVSIFQFQKKVENSSNYTTVSLSTTQKKEVACIICKETKTEKNRVFAMDGVACSESGVVDTNSTNTTTRRRILQTTDNNTEYYIVMPDLFVHDGSLEGVKTAIESPLFTTALESQLEGIKLKSKSCSIQSSYPILPLIQSPSVSPAENSITFAWTGANNTDGFVFVGVVEYSNSTVEPTAIQLKKNSGYSFTAFNKAYYQEDTSVSVTVSPTTKCLDYKYYWIATNQDPDTFVYTTGVKSGTTKTIGCPTFAKQLQYSLMILLAFLFVIML